MADLRAWSRTHMIFKVLELLIALICIGLLRHYDLNFGGDALSGSFHDRYLTGVITIGGMILVTAPLLISYFFGESGTYNPFLEMIYSFTGFVLFITSGGLVLSHYHSGTALLNVGQGRALGGLLLFNGFLYLIDMIIAVRHSQTN